MSTTIEIKKAMLSMDKTLVDDLSGSSCLEHQIGMVKLEKSSRTIQYQQ